MGKLKMDIRWNPHKLRYTVVECEKCGVFYEPYGKEHKCKKRKEQP